MEARTSRPSRSWSPGPLVVVAFAAVLAIVFGLVIEASRSGDDATVAPVPPPPEPLIEREVRFESGDVVIAGSLTLPPGPGPFPAAIKISGAGVQDRTDMASTPEEARVPPEIFARAGIALLRTDDRGAGDTTGDTYQATYDDLVADTVAAVAFLARQDEIDPTRIGLIGASLGAAVATQTAARHEDIAFVVLFSGMGLVGRKVLFDQIVRIDLAGGLPQETVGEILERTREAIGWIDAPIDDRLRREKLRPLARELRRLRRTSPFAAGDTELSIEREIDLLTSPAYRSGLSYDPAPDLRQLRCPVLVIHGELDLQVHPDVNLPPVEAALAAAPTDDVTIARFPGLNHMLQPAATGHPDEYGTSPRSPEVYKRTAAWIAERFAGAHGTQPGDQEQP